MSATILDVDAATSACHIKGNISINTGERIYHVPGQMFYDADDHQPAIRRALVLQRSRGPRRRLATGAPMTALN